MHRTGDRELFDDGDNMLLDILLVRPGSVFCFSFLPQQRCRRGWLLRRLSTGLGANNVLTESFVRKFWAVFLLEPHFESGAGCWAGLGWEEGLGWPGPGLGWAGLGCWAGLGWAGGWAGAGWAGLGWAGLGAGLAWAALRKFFWTTFCIWGWVQGEGAGLAWAGLGAGRGWAGLAGLFVGAVGGLGWAGLGWAVGWAGLGWVGLGWAAGLLGWAV